MHKQILNVIKHGNIGDKVRVNGWIRSMRQQKNNVFLDINDGSTIRNIQIVLNADKYKNMSFTTGSSVSLNGILAEAQGNNRLEIIDPDIDIIGVCDSTYPLQKKRHSFEYLREIAHLRSRGNTMGAVLRLRNSATMAVHNYFQNNGFIQIHTPILNSNDCEGAGELFLVNTKEDFDKSKNNTRNSFFNVDQCFLTVSGQLEAEIFASSMSKVYTFGPTFRAENSHTTRHLSEFWMIEPEIAFVDLDGVMDIAEGFIKSCVNELLDKSIEDLKFFNEMIDPTLLNRLDSDNKNEYGKITYSESIQILQKNGFNIKWGDDLPRECERFLCEEYLKKPVFVTNYPKKIKPFYMRVNEDGETVSCMDLLFPRIGEMIGGSQREERYDKLKDRIEEMNLDINSLDWYMDLRKYGSVPHGGFGLGFERFLLYMSGMENIRDVIPIPRYPNYCKF